MKRNSKQITTAILLCFCLSACTPTVQVQAPDKPIEINMNVKVEQDVNVRLTKGDSEQIENEFSFLGFSTKKKN